MPLPRRPKHSVCGGELFHGGCRGSFAEHEQPWGLGAYSRRFWSRQGVLGNEPSTVHNRHRKPDTPWERDPISTLTKQQHPSEQAQGRAIALNLIQSARVFR